MGTQTVLIADDDPDVIATVGAWCNRSGLSVVTASNGVEAVMQIKRHLPALLIVDVDMPHADGFQVCKRFRELSPEHNPAIVLTGMSDAATMQQCSAVGAHHVTKDHETWSNLDSLLSKFTANVADKPNGDFPVPANYSPPVPAAPPRILVVDDDPDVTAAIRIRLAYYGAEVDEAYDGIQAYNCALANKPDVIITDYNMPRGSGDHLMVRLKQNAQTRKIPIIVLTGELNEFGKNIPLQRDVLGRRGAVAFLPKPLDHDELITELQKHVSSPLELRKKKRTASAT